MMSDLIERLEAATGPCRELDAAILTQVMGYRDVYGDGTVFDRGNDGYWYVGEHSAPQLPAPTASIDAALTLVPAELANHSLLSISPMSLDMGGRNWKCQVGKHRASAPTPALAIVIAALRAKGVINE